MSISELANELLKARELCERLGAEKSEAEANLKALKARMVESIQAIGADKLSVEGYSFSLSSKCSVNLPSTDEDRRAFFNYLKERGLFEQMISVHSSTLNSFYSGEEKSALENGDIDFSIPGIKNVNRRIDLGIRKS